MTEVILEHSYLQDCDTVLLGEWFPTFCRITRRIFGHTLHIAETCSMHGENKIHTAFWRENKKSKWEI
jgi:hypothetical protein